jgi:hypothetical protein
MAGYQILHEGKWIDANRWDNPYGLPNRIAQNEVMTKSKIDTTEMKKLLKAFGIMALDANKKAELFNTRLERIRVELERYRVSKQDDGSALRVIKEGTLSGRNKKRAYTYATLPKYKFFVPKRCNDIILKIRELYPRLSEVSDLDKAQIVESIEVTEESVAWAEHVATSNGVAIVKDKMYITIETVSTIVKAFVSTEDLTDEDVLADMELDELGEPPILQEDVKKAFVLKAKKDANSWKAKASGVIGRLKRNKIKSTYSKVEILEV